MEPNKQITEEQHERLCAYLFEELDTAARAAFEVELAASPALQAEREMISASMDLVREFAPAAPLELSTESRAALVAAAGEAPVAPRPWYRNPVFQAAAASMTIIALVRAPGNPPVEQGPVINVAELREAEAARIDHRVKKRASSPQPPRAAAPRPRLAGLGYPDGGLDHDPVIRDARRPESSAVAGSPAKTSIFRGPGDTLPPGYGLAAPSSSVSAGSQDWFLGAGEESWGPEQEVASAEELERGTAPGGQHGQVLSAFERLIQRASRLPDEKPSAMYFRYWGDNGFDFPVNDPLSTFAADVDTASYALARRTIKNGYLPQRAQIRTEEFVNYFTPDVPAPEGDAVFNITHELGLSPFGPSGPDAMGVAAEGSADRWLLRVGVRGEVIPVEERSPLALTFVIDVSGSMESGNRIGLVKHALRLLSSELNEGDSIAIVSFSKTAKRVLEMQSAGNAAAFERALFDLKTGGGTNVQSGLRMGYEEAVLGFVKGAVNRVVFLSDGVGNIGETDQKILLNETKRAREKGVYLNTIGVGMGNHNDTFLEQLANGGDGICNYVDDADEAERALVRNFTGAFQPIARDVKLQVDFDPAQVLAYRLLGYENRAIADVDFRNDKVDAGEIGSGHQVVALYELVLNEVDAGGEAPLATTRLRYKLPHSEVEGMAEGAALEIESACTWDQAFGDFDAATVGFQKSALAAQFAEMLRRSSHARQDSVSLLRYKLEALAKSTGDEELAELAALVQLAQPQLEAALLDVSPVRQATDDLAEFEWHCGTREYLGDQVEDVDARREELREKLREKIDSSGE